MKKILALLMMLAGLIFPWACSDNKTPSQPTAPLVAFTNTPTGTQTPGTPTFTPTPPPGAATNTPTPTFALPVPVYQNNYSTSAAPRGMVQNGAILTVAESEFKNGGLVTVMELYTGAGTATLNLYNCCPTGSGPYPNVGNIIKTGCPPIPTPGATPITFTASLTTLRQIQGFVNPGGDVGGGWSAVLDLNGSGGANLYCGYYNSWNNATPPLDHNFMPFLCNGYGGVPFKNPSAMCDDGTGGSGHMYIADTGNSTVDELSPYEGTCPLGALPIYRWYGAAGVTQGGTGVIFASAAVSFRSPTAVACDTTGNVWVGDTGYFSTTGTSYVMEFTSGATTILQSWQTVYGCKVSGLAINSGTGNVYVADSGNNMVEVYSPTGTLLTAFGDPGPAAHEFYPFAPSVIAFSGGFIYVGDSSNDYIDVFQ